MRKLLPTIFLLLAAVSAWAAIRVQLLPNFDLTLDTEFALGNKPDTGATLPAPWNRCTIDGAVLTFDAGANTVEEDEGVFTVSSQSGSVAIAGTSAADDHIDAPVRP